MASVTKPTASLSRQEILHTLRCKMESCHQELIRQRSTDFRWLYQLNIADLDSLAADMTLEEAVDCCNKAVPVYIFAAKRRIYTFLLLEVLHNYLFRKWFRPYRSELEYMHFLAGTFLPELLPGDLQPGPLVDLAVSVHKTICDRVQSAQDAVRKLDPDDQQPQDPNLPKQWGWCRGLYLPQIIKSQEYFILRPLFRALIISIRGETYRNKDTDMSQLPVLLIRTGVEDGLSAPISFEPIARKIESFVNGSHGEAAARMALETAIDFVISLEKREVAAFGPQPDPVASTRDLEDGGICGPSVLYEARTLGWGDEPLAGPSSQWVIDVENCPKESPYGNLDESMNEAEMVARASATWFEENRPEEPRGIPWRGGKHF